MKIDAYRNGNDQMVFGWSAANMERWEVGRLLGFLLRQQEIFCFIGPHEYDWFVDDLERGVRLVEAERHPVGYIEARAFTFQEKKAHGFPGGVLSFHTRKSVPRRTSQVIWCYTSADRRPVPSARDGGEGSTPAEAQSQE